MTIEILKINITDFADVSTHDGVAFMPTTMAVDATINGISVENIIIRYIPITSKEEIINEIKKTLVLNDN